MGVLMLGVILFSIFGAFKAIRAYRQEYSLYDEDFQKPHCNKLLEV